MRRAAYTVEAVFVFSICLWVLLALMYGSFYVHDRTIVGAMAGNLVDEHFQRGSREVSDRWEKEIKDKLSDSMYMMRIQKVKAKKQMAGVEVKIKYKIPISISGIKSLFTGKKEEDTIAVCVEIPTPMKYKWDADLLKDKGK